MLMNADISPVIQIHKPKHCVLVLSCVSCQLCWSLQAVRSWSACV